MYMIHEAEYYVELGILLDSIMYKHIYNHKCTEAVKTVKMKVVIINHSRLAKSAHKQA